MHIFEIDVDEKKEEMEKEENEEDNEDGTDDDDIMLQKAADVLYERDKLFGRAAYDLLGALDKARVMEATRISPGRRQASYHRDQFIDGMKGLAGLFFDANVPAKYQPEASRKSWEAFQMSNWAILGPVMPATFGKIAVENAVKTALNKTAVKFNMGKEQKKKAQLFVKMENQGEGQVTLSLVLFVY